MDLPGWSIPLSRAALCGGCLVIFDMKESRCPKCQTELGWTSVESNRAAQLIKEQRDLLHVAYATLRVVALRRLGATSLMCARVVDRLSSALKQTAPSVSAPEAAKESVQ